MDQRPNCRALGGESAVVSLGDFGVGDGFLNMTPKEQAAKEKVDKMDFIEIKHICASKDTTENLERQPTKGRIYLQITHTVRNYI